MTELPNSRAVVSLVPQKREFFVLYSRAARNTVAIAQALLELLEEFPRGEGLLRDIKDLEHEGDRLTREVVDLLNRTFVTPFDRDDMYELASALDDICDHIDEAAGNIAGYGVTEIRPFAKEQAQVILRSTQNWAHSAWMTVEKVQDAIRVICRRSTA